MRHLRFNSTLRRDHLRARMIKWNERPSVPILDRSRVFFQRKFMILNKFQRLKSDTSECCHDRRIDQRQQARQIGRTVSDLALFRPPIGVRGRSRTAHHGRCYEDLITAQAHKIKQLLEILARFIAIKRSPGAVGTDPTGRLADKEDLWFQRTVQIAQDRGLIC